MDYNSEIQFYDFNGIPRVFVCTEESFDDKGWGYVDGFTFKEKLLLLKLNVFVRWQYINQDFLNWLSKHFMLAHPEEFTIAVGSKEIKAYIRDERILNCNEIKIDLASP